MAATTTTTIVADATTADPKVLAVQLQAVLDRSQELYLASRTDPERPFVDQQLIDDFRQVAETHVLAGLVRIWQRFRDEGSAVRPGPSVDTGPFITALTQVTPSAVDATYCIYDDGVTYEKPSGAVLDDKTFIGRGVVDFVNRDGHWIISRREPVETSELVAGSANPCPAERVS